MNLDRYQILLIDDDEDDFVNLRDLLQEASGSRYDITWKFSYEQGLAALSASKFDLCLLDYRLGEHTGIDLLKEARERGVACPIIFLTGQGDFDLDVQVMQMGAAEYLVKDQLTAPLLERTIRYSVKHALDMEELKESKAQILQQDRLASLGLLASSLAHEIGTPLGIIRSRAEMAAKKAGTNEDLKQDMTTVITQIDRISSLVQSLLNLARGKHSEFATSVNLDEVLKDVVNLLKHELHRKDISLELSVPPGLVVKAESGPLGQVFLNLLVNAVHAIEDAQKSKVDRRHAIHINAKDLTDSVEISVEDTGPGISEKNLPQLFKPFFTTKDIGVGSGLGLATSYKLVHSWSGSITVQSPVGSGARFTVKLLKPSKF